MFTTIIQPKSGDTDRLGHINNAALALWFETARNPIIRIFVPDLNFTMEAFPFIVAHTDFNFTDQLLVQHEIEVRTWVSHIGSKSFTVHHQVWQKERLCATGSAVIVHYDFNTKQSTPLPADKKKRLKEHLISGGKKSPRPAKKPEQGA